MRHWGIQGKCLYTSLVLCWTCLLPSFSSFHPRRKYSFPKLPRPAFLSLNRNISDSCRITFSSVAFFLMNVVKSNDLLFYLTSRSVVISMSAALNNVISSLSATHFKERWISNQELGWSVRFRPQLLFLAAILSVWQTSTLSSTFCENSSCFKIQKTRKPCYYKERSRHKPLQHHYHNPSIFHSLAARVIEFLWTSRYRIVNYY